MVSKNRELYLSQGNSDRIQLEISIAGMEYRCFGKTHCSSLGMDAFYKSCLQILSELPTSKLPTDIYILECLCALFQPPRYRPSQTADYPEFAYLAHDVANCFRQMNVPQDAHEKFSELLTALDDWANALESRPQES
jgi:hypothetical protein